MAFKELANVDISHDIGYHIIIHNEELDDTHIIMYINTDMPLLT